MQPGIKNLVIGNGYNTGGIEKITGRIEAQGVYDYNNSGDRSSTYRNCSVISNFSIVRNDRVLHISYDSTHVESCRTLQEIQFEVATELKHLGKSEVQITENRDGKTYTVSVPFTQRIAVPEGYPLDITLPAEPTDPEAVPSFNVVTTILLCFTLLAFCGLAFVRRKS